MTPKTDAGASPQENTIGEEFKELPVEEQLANIALQSQRAGNVAGLLDSFLTPWAKDGVLLFQRSGTNEKYQQQFDLKNLESRGVWI